ncbi:MAG: Gfo/Idh/MocA family oxidoreductase [Flavobacteriaceae bacterium]|nr:Gfo/Idh/MocA family oxidoreductase [Flavobacteriaceae bacterium]
MAPGLVACQGEPEDMPADDISSRLKPGIISGAMFDYAAEPISTVKIGMIGMGNRGSVLIQMFDYLISNNHAEIRALCDLDQEKVERNNEYLKNIQTTTADLYSGDPNAWKTIAERDDIDLLIICTPWKYHAEMAVYGMEKGKHVACEVPIAYTMEDCWKLIETSEATQRHCMMMENCCFNGEELWILNMIDRGVFGDLNHAEGAYIHDLRMHMLHDTYYADQWRIKHHQERNGNFYTTHGLGPVSFYMDIGRGDNYDHLVSMSSREQSLSIAAKQAKSNFADFSCGDMNTTLIRTKQGRTIMLQFDVHTGRPYSRLNTLTGTKAVHQGYPSRLYVGQDELKWSHAWLEEKEYRDYRERYDHPLWKKLKEQIDAKAIGHGGMDFVMIFRLIRCLNQGLPLDINVYDGVLWSAVTPLTELSVANGSMAIPIPDFTAGKWKNEQRCPVLREIL